MAKLVEAAARASSLALAVAIAVGCFQEDTSVFPNDTPEVTTLDNLCNWYQFPATGCPAGYSCCNGTHCSHLGSDENHCGGCNNPCQEGEQCHNGSCFCGSPRLQKTCDQGEACCNSTCVDTQTDSYNCGGCNNVCPCECSWSYANSCRAYTPIECIDGGCNPLQVPCNSPYCLNGAPGICNL